MGKAFQPKPYAAGSNKLNTHTTIMRTLQSTIPPPPADSPFNADMLFLGSSHCARWFWFCPEILALFNTWYSQSLPSVATPPRFSDAGIGGDTTEHLLWRLDQGVLSSSNIQPRWIVLCIGSNNLTRTSGSEVAQAIGLVVDRILAQCPHSTLLVHSVFPRRDAKSPGKPQYSRTSPPDAAYFRNAPTCNQILQDTYGDRRVDRVVLVELWDLFIDSAAGSAAPDTMQLKSNMYYDAVHLSKEGYSQWRHRLQSVLATCFASSTSSESGASSSTTASND
jgi:lysophospholipase L1-like esterase